MSKKYQKLASEILAQVGGQENVSALTHCMTRLRFTLKDESKADANVVRNIEGVTGCVSQGGQFQVIIGTHVEEVYEEIAPIGGESSNDDNNNSQDGKGAVSKILDTIAGCFTPVIGALAGAGMVKAMLSLLSVLGWIDTSGQTYTILNTIGDSVFYFLPFILAVSSAKKFKTNPYIAMAMAGVLLHPNISAFKDAGEAVHFLGIPVVLASYSSSVIPILLIVWLQSYIEKFVKKITPNMIKIFFVPMVVMLICAPVGLIAFGPLGTIIGDVLASFLTWLESYGSWIVPTLIGCLCPLLVMTGMHYSLIPIRYAQMGMLGYESFLMPAMLVSNVCQGAASLAVGIKTKNKDLKTVATSSGFTALLGITEPALYGVNMKLKTPLYSTMIGGAVGGFYVGLMGVRNYASGGTSLLGLPTFIGENTMHSIIHESIGIAIGFAVTFIVTMIIGIKENEEKEADKPVSNESNLPTPTNSVVKAPIQGEVFELSAVKDEVFSSEMMGKGVAILPEQGRVVSPIKGTVSMVFETKHAIGLVSEDGVEVLIHVGMDTVQLKGEHFTSHVKQGDSINVGDLLVEFDKEAIADKGYELLTPIVITNSGQYADVFGNVSQSVKETDDLITVLV